MKFYTIAILCLLSCIFCEKEHNSAYRFVSNIYATFLPDSLMFVLDSPIADTIFTPDFLALIKLDEKMANGETGFLNWNPLCDCQDDGGMKVSSITFSEKKGKTYAEVKLAFSLEKRTVVLQLAKIKHRWLINDIETQETPSLCKYLSEKLQGDIK
jgi:hypothetical protein